MGHHLARSRDSGEKAPQQLVEELRLLWKEQHERGLGSGVPAGQVPCRSSRPCLSTRLCLVLPVTWDLSLRCLSTRDCYLPAQTPTESPQKKATPQKQNIQPCTARSGGKMAEHWQCQAMPGHAGLSGTTWSAGLGSPTF